VCQELLQCGSWLVPASKLNKNKGELPIKSGEVDAPLDDKGLHPGTVINVTQRWSYR
jgi:hypothetical protein